MSVPCAGAERTGCGRRPTPASSFPRTHGRGAQGGRVAGVAHGAIPRTRAADRTAAAGDADAVQGRVGQDLGAGIQVATTGRGRADAKAPGRRRGQAAHIEGREAVRRASTHDTFAALTGGRPVGTHTAALEGLIRRAASAVVTGAVQGPAAAVGERPALARVLIATGVRLARDRASSCAPTTSSTWTARTSWSTTSSSRWTARTSWSTTSSSRWTARTS